MSNTLDMLRKLIEEAEKYERTYSGGSISVTTPTGEVIHPESLVHSTASLVHAAHEGDKVLDYVDENRIALSPGISRYKSEGYSKLSGKTLLRNAHIAKLRRLSKSHFNYCVDKNFSKVATIEHGRKEKVLTIEKRRRRK